MEKTTMKKLSVFLMLLMSTLLFACEKKDAAQTTTEPAANTAGDTKPAADEKKDPEVLAVKDGESLTLAQLTGGKKLDPPAKLDQLPAGAYFCDMGTAHYAREVEGDGRCPLCSMKLVKKADAAPGEEAKPAEAGHEHKEGEAGHEH